MQKFQDVLDGKLKVAELTAEELPQFVTFAQGKSAEILAEAEGRRGARQAEETKLNDLTPKVTEAQTIIAEAERLKGPTLSPEMQSLRAENIEKAKQRLPANVRSDASRMVLVMDAFKRLDTGKLDADNIYRDLLSAVASTEPERFLELSQDAEQRAANAARELEAQAAGGGGAPSKEEAAKYSQEVVDLAKNAGITLEAAKRQVEQGNRRIIE